MTQQDTSPIKRQIVEFIEKNGPSLPAHVASEIKQSILFASAFLAELLSEKKLILSDMKVGGSPLYMIDGQEPLLERYSIYLKGKPGEAYKLLKDERFLKDSEQLPAIRVALRSIKDFAKPFKFKDEIYWRYLTSNIDDFLMRKNEKKDVFEERAGEAGAIKVDMEGENEEKNTGDDSEKEKVHKKLNASKDGVDVPFADRVRVYLKKEHLTVLEETDVKKREFLGRGRIQSEIGEIEVLIIGRDKKNISEKDMEKIMEEVIDKKMFVLFLSSGEIVKKAKDIYREHKNLVKFVRI